MAEAWEIEARGRERTNQIRLQADLRRQDRITSEEFDVEIEKLRGESERELTLLTHDLDKENRALDLKFEELKNSQQVRLEAIQTSIKQQDDFFRHFWEIDKEVVRLETRLVEMVMAGRIGAEQTVLEHGHSIETKARDQSHELRMEAERRVNTSHTTDEEIRKARALKELDREFQSIDEEAIGNVLQKLDKI